MLDCPKLIGPRDILVAHAYIVSIPYIFYTRDFDDGLSVFGL